MKVIHEKFKFLTYFVKEREKWTLLHKNQFLDGATFQVTILNTSYDFLWKQTKFFSNHMHMHSLKGSSWSLCIRRIDFLKKEHFFIRRNVSNSHLNIKELEFWGKKEEWGLWPYANFIFWWRLLIYPFWKLYIFENQSNTKL